MDLPDQVHQTILSLPLFIRLIPIKRTMNQPPKFLLSFLLFVQLAVDLSAAIPDSLSVQISSNDKRVAIRALRTLVSLQVDSLANTCLDYAKKARQLASELDDGQLIASSDFSVASCFEHLNQADSALSYYDKALAGFQINQDIKGTIDCLNNISVIYKRQGNYPKALDLQLEGLALRKQLGDQRELCKAYNNLGNLYLAIRDTAQAIDSYAKGKEIAEKSADSTAGIYLGLNLSRLFATQKQYEKARPILLRILKLSREQNMIIGSVSALNLLSFIEQSCQNHEESFRLAQEAVRISRGHDYIPGLIDSYDILGEYYKQKKDYRQSLDHYLEALKIVDEHDFKEKKYGLLLNLSGIYEIMQMPEKALSHYKAYAALKDSIYNQDNDQQLAFIQYKHELESKEKEKLFLEEKYEKQQQQQAFTFLLVVLLLFIIVMLGILIYKHKLARKYLLELNEQKDRMFSLISHDLRGPIGNIRNIFEVIGKEDLPPEEIKAILAESKEVIDHSYQVLENLLYWVRSQTGRMHVHPEEVTMAPLVSQCLKLFSPMIRQKKIQVDNKISNDHQVYSDKEMIEAVIRNLISNAVKFSFPNGQVSIDSMEEGNQLILTVSDSGTGMNKETISMIMKNKLTSSKKGTFNEKGTGIGLRICHDFILRNKGKLSIESEVGKGSRFSVRLPVQRHRMEYKKKNQILYPEQSAH